MEKLPIPPYWVRRPRALATTAGAHRWLWDIRYAPPASTRHEYPIAAIPFDTQRTPLGPWVLPGNYSVKLIVESKTFTAPITVVMDPRVKTPLAALRQLHDAQRQLASMLTRTTRAVRQATSLRDYIDKAKNELAPRGELGGLNSSLYSLYNDTASADVAPTTAQSDALKTLSAKFEAVMKNWSSVIAEDLPKLNQQRKAEGKPEITVQEPNVEDDDDGDDDVG
jgi:hypothetical protein